MLKNSKQIGLLAKRLLDQKKFETIRSFRTSLRILDKKDEKQKKVKLYPGFQVSHEEFQQQLNNENHQDLFAKKVIEDFYGLNELEYEKEGEETQGESQEEYQEFNVDSAVQFLKSENVQDIACIQIPKEINYADYMIIGTCLSDKHLNSVFMTINKKYKSLKSDTDSFLNRKSGKESKWCAIDTGKIVIHLFLAEYRQYYDLECLWTCGSEYDEKYLEFREEQQAIEKKLSFLEVDETRK